MKDAEHELERLYSTLPSINCKKLCAEGCGPIAMSVFEHRRILAVAPEFPAKLMPVRLESGQLIGNGFVSDCGTCPLLKDGQCSQYARRPLVCRLWGLVQTMRCPYGCTPARWVSPRESFKLLNAVERISRKAAAV